MSDAILLLILRVSFVATCMVAALLLMAPGHWFGLNQLVYNDLAVHAGTYVAVVVTGTLAFYPRRAFLWALLGAAAIGTECAQLLVPSREFSFADMGANMAGLLIGIIVGLIVARLVARLRPQILEGSK